MRWAWLAAGYAAAWVVACSTTNNVTNVTNVVDDAGSEDAAAGPAEAGAQVDGAVDVSDAGVDASEDAEAGPIVCSGGNDPAPTVSNDDCYAANPCPFDYCGPSGFAYRCGVSGGDAPPIEGCRRDAKTGLHCCNPQCVRFKTGDPGGCSNVYSCPKASDGGPAIPIPAGCTPKGGTTSIYWPNDGYVVCCPD